MDGDDHRAATTQGTMSEDRSPGAGFKSPLSVLASAAELPPFEATATASTTTHDTCVGPLPSPPSSAIGVNPAASLARSHLDDRTQSADPLPVLDTESALHPKPSTPPRSFLFSEMTLHLQGSAATIPQHRFVTAKMEPNTNEILAQADAQARTAPSGHLLQPSIASSGSSMAECHPQRFMTPPTSGNIRATKAQLKVLEQIFEENPMPSGLMHQAISDRIGMSKKAVRNWFQNQRAKVRRLEQEDRYLRGADAEARYFQQQEDIRQRMAVQTQQRPPPPTTRRAAPYPSRVEIQSRPQYSLHPGIAHPAPHPSTQRPMAPRYFAHYQTPSTHHQVHHQSHPVPSTHYALLRPPYSHILPTHHRHHHPHHSVQQQVLGSSPAVHCGRDSHSQPAHYPPSGHIAQHIIPSSSPSSSTVSNVPPAHQPEGPYFETSSDARTGQRPRNVMCLSALI